MVRCTIFVLLVSSLAYMAKAADDDLLAALEEGDSRDDKLIVDANEGAQLANNKKRGGLIVYKPMLCELKKYDNVQYYGTLTRYFTNINSVETCVSTCWQYNLGKGENGCRSVNYYTSLKKCELQRDILDVDDKKMFKYYARANNDSVYAVPSSCAEAGKPKPDALPDAPKSSHGRSARAGGCGQSFVSPRSIQRIVGGVEARPHSLPWQVSIRSGDWHFCGGSLIRTDNSDQSDVVITAAHCLYREKYDMKVALGAHWKSRTQAGEQRVAVQRYILHPQYNPNNNQAHDIAIVKLAQKVKFGNTIQPVCLPASNEQVADNVMGIVSGWGDLREGTANYPDALNQVSVPTINSQSCRQSYGGGLVPTAMLCAGYAQGAKDSCQGDSGGPYVIQGRDGYVLQGVVSFGSGCARANAPGVYARTAAYVDWIQQTIRSLGSGGGTGTGNTGNTNRCVDEITYCQDYIRDCNTQGWMKTACAKSCGFCR